MAFFVRRDVVKRIQGNFDTASIHAGKLPIIMGWLAAWKSVEKQLQATAGDFGERKFPLGGECLGTLVKLVRKLDLGARHDVNLTSLGDVVNS